MKHYNYTPECREVSGFGGGYENACRTMIKAGMQWFDNNPDADDPEFIGFKNVYGIVEEDNGSAKALSQYMVESVTDYGISGAQHQASVSHVLYAHKNGWDKYIEEMSKENRRDEG